MAVHSAVSKELPLGKNLVASLVVYLDVKQVACWAEYLVVHSVGLKVVALTVNSVVHLVACSAECLDVKVAVCLAASWDDLMVGQSVACSVDLKGSLDGLMADHLAVCSADPMVEK